MRQRIIVALIALPIVLIPIWLGGAWSFGLLLAIALLGAQEFYAMMEKGGYHPARELGLLWTALFVLHGWQPQMLPLTTVLTLGFIAVLIRSLYQQQQPASMWMSTSVGAIYLGGMAAQALSLRLLENGLWWLLFGVLITWANDTVAYFTGVTVGRHKLWPRLSPKKTWEGTVAGWIGAAAAGGLLAWLLPMQADILAGVLVGGVAGVLALFGDLSVSMLKRQVGVKDSGTLFPGHGGMLDRLDSLLFVLPVIYLIVLRLPQ